MRRAAIISLGLVLVAGASTVIYLTTANKANPAHAKLKAGLIAHNDEVRLLKSKCKTISISLVQKRERPKVVVTDPAVIQKVLDCLVVDVENEKNYQQDAHLCYGNVEIRFDESWWKVIHFDHGVGIYSFGNNKLGFLILPPAQAQGLVDALRSLGYSDTEIGLSTQTGSNQ